MVNLKELNEHQLFLLFKREYPDLIDLNEEDPLSPVDWYSKELNLHFEAKCRKEHYPTLFLEEKKYKVLLKYKNVFYVNSTPEGIYGWDIHKLDPIFREVLMTNSQQFYRKDKYIYKSVTELPISRCHFRFTHKLLY